MLKAYVIVDSVVVHTGRGPLFPKLGSFYKGDAVTILDDTLDAEYAKVVWIAGYAYSDKGKYIHLINPSLEIDPDQPNAVAADNISVRKGRGINYVKLGIFSEGETFTALEDPSNADYIRVVYQMGYVHSKKGQNLRIEDAPFDSSSLDPADISADEASSVADSISRAPDIVSARASTSNPPNAVVTANRISVREGRGESYPKLGEFVRGDKITVLDKTLAYDYAHVIWQGTTAYAYCEDGEHINFIYVPPENGINAIVTANVISVREGRGESYPKLGEFVRNDKIAVRDDTLQYDYVRVTFNNTEGYAYCDFGKYVQFLGEPVEPPQTQANAIVTANRISVRKGRGESYPKLGEFVRGDEITVLDKTLAYDYVHVVWQSTTAYAYCDNGEHINFIYVPPKDGINAIVTANVISVREGRGESFPKLGEFVRNDKIAVRDKTLQYDYVRVVFNDTEGYAYCDSGKYIQFLSEPVQPTPTETNAIVTAGHISVREGRGLNYTKLGEFVRGDKIIVLDDILDYDYVHVVWENTTGYAYCNFGEYIKFTDDQQLTDDCRAEEPNAVVTANVISVREGRGVSYPKIGELKRDDTIVVLDDTLDYNYVSVACFETAAYAYCDYGMYIRFLAGDTADEISRTLDIVASCVGGKYIYGGQGKKITESYVRRQAERYPQYFTGGRFEYLLNIGKRCDASGVWQFPADYCWDCSGLWWYSANKAGIYGKNIDTTANTFYHSYCVPVEKSALVAGDAVFYRNSSGRITHMGIVGKSGVVYEAMSGYVGVIVGDSVNDRTAPRIVGSGNYKGRTWNAFGRPKIFLTD